MNYSSKIIVVVLIVTLVLRCGKKLDRKEKMAEKHTNKLINEKSPYLLQHAHNPVNWFPWDDEAFKKARDENKPIFLSIGYSTCHWCHVMEYESFEDPIVANLMNDVFVSIKVDREERPDIDNIYMTVCQIMTGHGGWPLTILMTPDKKPFFAGTYFPKDTRGNRMGMIDLINRVNELWHQNRDELDKSANEITGHLLNSAVNNNSSKMDENIFEKAAGYFESRFDNKFGGFGNAPKFPSPHNLMFLLREWKRTGKTKYLNMVESTLRSMRFGGVYDHIGFGFHRYSTDQEWLLPHFEKMLYDQAMISHALIELYQATGKLEFKKNAEEIFEYVLRDMSSPEGGFYSAEDADSDGEEGKFYLWDKNELIKILGKEDAELISKVYNADSAGNFKGEATRAATGMNILYLQTSLDEITKELNIDNDKIEELRVKLFNEREKRIHPHKDDKILTDWNGLMIAALAKASVVFDNENYFSAAAKAVDFIEDKLMDEGKLLHRYRDGESAFTANLDDYAFLSWGFIELFEASGNTQYLKSAVKYAEAMTENFEDFENGGFYFTRADNNDLLTRTKDGYDSAIPSGNSIAAYLLIRLSRITGNLKYEETAERIFASFAEQINRTPGGFGMMLSALNFNRSEAFEIIITSSNRSDTKRYLKAINEKFIPNKSIILRTVGNGKSLIEFAPYLKNYLTEEMETKVFVCKNYSCELPVTDIDDMMKLLGEEK